MAEVPRAYFPLLGHSRHTIDDKGRLALPRSFRERMPQGADGRYVICTKPEVPIIQIHHASEWREVEVPELQRLDNPTFNDQMELLLRIAACAEVEADSSSRVLIPRYLLEHAELQPGLECVAIAKGRCLEIMRADLFDQLVQASRPGTTRIQEWLRRKLQETGKAEE